MEDIFVLLLQAPGYIFGPLMMLAGFVAVVMCVWATFRTDRGSARRALMWSAVPPVLGVLGVIFGAIVWALNGPASDPARARLALFLTIVFGVFCALVPALWALVLVQRRPPALA